MFVYIRVYPFHNDVGYNYVWEKIEGERGFQDLSSIVAIH